MKHDDGRKSMRAIAIALACMLLAACGDEEHADIKSWMKEASKDLKGHVPPLPEVKEFPAIAYDAGNLVSPFEAKKDRTRQEGCQRWWDQARFESSA